MVPNRKPIVQNIRHDADTWSLVDDVTTTAFVALRHCSWPEEIPRSEAAETMHAYAAEVDYIAEDGTQYIRAPWITAQQRRADCKSTAILIASMCAAAGRRVELKFLQYDDNDGDHWAHVYAVVDGVPVDPLLPFGEEYPYLRHLKVRIR